jgi:2-polyprenyl-3-methyl-5-hydroxy-6-metoxy-1,4-benzoquinol methylase
VLALSVAEVKEITNVPTNPIRTAQIVTCPLCHIDHTVEMEAVACNLCGARDEELLFHRGDLYVGLPGEFRVVRCRRCGLTYVNPRPTVQAIDYYYPPRYEPYRHPDVEGARTPWGRWWRAYYLNKRCRAVSRYQSGGRILDVGCATGAFLHQMRHWGDWERHGVELVATAAQQAQERYGLQVFAGTLEQAAYPDQFFDAVTMWDLLEHVHDPTGTLRQAARVLKPGGLLALSTVQSDALDARLFGRYWVGYEVPRHLYVFSRRTLSDMLAQSGFRIVGQKVLYGSNYAFSDSVRFALQGHGAPRWLHGGVFGLLRSRPWRWLSAPAFKLLDLLQLTTPPTIFCRRT